MEVEMKAGVKAAMGRKRTGHGPEMKAEMDRKWIGNESGNGPDMEAEIEPTMPLLAARRSSLCCVKFKMSCSGGVQIGRV